MEILVNNLSQLIESLLDNGTISMSQKNLQQICPTTGLNCTIEQYHHDFDQALNVVKQKYPNFKIVA